MPVDENPPAMPGDIYCVNLRKGVKIYAKDKISKHYFHTDYGFYYGVRNDML